MKGILFKDWKIKAIAEDDREWQTRRVIKPQPDKGLRIACYTVNDKPIDWVLADEDGDPIDSKCPQPRYQVGEVVYIKEAHYRYGEWRKNGLTKTGKQKWLFHPMPEMLTISTIKGIESLRYFDNPPDEVKPNSYRKEGWYKRSPLFMPEWAARYFEKITDIRAERLQEITWEDVLAEGIAQYTFARGCCSDNPPDPRWKFIELWDSINPKYPWESNPWVFAYSFKKAEK